jgi:stress response protein YsnF
MPSYETEQVRLWIGRTALDVHGREVGRVEDVLEDERLAAPTWFVVRTDAMGGPLRLAPVHGATAAGPQLRLPWELERIEATPWDDVAPGDLATAPAVPTVTGDDAMTRAEEELDVRVQANERGRVRVRTWVDEDLVRATVPVRREVARLVHAPVAPAAAAPLPDGIAPQVPDVEIGEEVHELVLFADELVVDRVRVPKERVRIETDVVEEERVVSDVLRKERVALDEQRLAPDDRRR